MDEWMDGQIDEQNMWVKRWVSEWIVGLTDGWVDGYMDRLITGEWIDLQNVLIALHEGFYTQSQKFLRKRNENVYQNTQGI